VAIINLLLLFVLVINQWCWYVCDSFSSL